MGDLGGDVELVYEADLLGEFFALLGGEVELHLLQERRRFQRARHLSRVSELRFRAEEEEEEEEEAVVAACDLMRRLTEKDEFLMRRGWVR